MVFLARGTAEIGIVFPSEKGSYHCCEIGKKAGGFDFLTHTVATGVVGDPTAPGNRNGGAVSRKRERLF
jgi:hypothetical protein